MKKLNVMKFSMNVRNTAFVTDAIIKYKLDMNFIDEYDGRSFMDFLFEDELSLRKSISVNRVRLAALNGPEKDKVVNNIAFETEKAENAKRMYLLLKNYGGKHRNELKL